MFRNDVGSWVFIEVCTGPERTGKREIFFPTGRLKKKKNERQIIFLADKTNTKFSNRRKKD